MDIYNNPLDDNLKDMTSSYNDAMSLNKLDPRKFREAAEISGLVQAKVTLQAGMLGTNIKLCKTLASCFSGG